MNKCNKWIKDKREIYQEKRKRQAKIKDDDEKITKDITKRTLKEKLSSNIQKMKRLFKKNNQDDQSKEINILKSDDGQVKSQLQDEMKQKVQEGLTD